MDANAEQTEVVPLGQYLAPLLTLTLQHACAGYEIYDDVPAMIEGVAVESAYMGVQVATVAPPPTCSHHET